MNTADMNKIAIAFAAFAAWYVLTPKAAAGQTPGIAERIFGIAKQQRNEVGAAMADNVKFADDITAQYAKRQGVNNASRVDILGHTAEYYAFQPSYALG